MSSDTPLTFLIQVSTSHLVSSPRPFRVSELLIQLGEEALSVSITQRKLDESQFTDGQLSDLARELVADAALDFIHVRHGGSSSEVQNFTTSVADDPSLILNKVQPTHVFQHSRVWLLKETEPE